MLAWLALVVCSLAMGVTAVLQALLVLGWVRFEQTIGIVLAAGAAIGLWLIGSNLLAGTGGVLVIAGYSVWEVWLRCLLLTGALATAAI